MGIAIAGPLQALATSALEASALALLAVFLFHLHKRVGLIPLLFLLAALALLVPLTSGNASLDLGARGAAPRALAIVVPVFVAGVLLLHITMGWRNAQLAATMPLGAGLLAGIASLVSPYMPTLFPPTVLPGDPVVPFIVGAALWLAAVAAVGVFHLFYRLNTGMHVVPMFIVACMLSLGLQGALLGGVAALGVGLEDVGLPAIIAVPVLIGLLPVVFLSIAAEQRVAGLPPDLRHELLAAPVFGTRSLVEEFERAEKLYQEGLREGQAEAATYIELIESDKEGAYVCDAGGRITYANAALANLLGRPGESLAGENIALLLGQPGNAVHPPKPDDKALKPGAHRAYVVLPSGHKRLVQVKVERGSAGTMHGHVSDLTGELVRRELQRQKRRAEFYLHILHNSVASHLEAPVGRLEHARARPGLDAGVDAEIGEALDGLRDIATFLHRIEVLGSIERVTPEATDLAPMLDATAAALMQRHGDDLSITWDLPDEAILVRGSPLLTEVFSALIDNAVRHGGAPVNVRIAAERGAHDTWTVRVEDDGPGLPDEVRAQLAASPDAEDLTGTGLGLHIARSIVAALGGRIAVEDRVPGEPASGTSVHVTLPPAPRAVGGWGASQTEEARGNAQA